MAEHHDEEGRGAPRAAERARSARLLRQIAGVLGKPVSEFAEPDTDGLRIAEMMGLWERLSIGERDALLHEMREKVERRGSATPELNAAADKDA